MNKFEVNVHPLIVVSSFISTNFPVNHDFNFVNKHDLFINIVYATSNMP